MNSPTNDNIEPIEIKCPKCELTKIIYIPKEVLPKCPKCGVDMVFKELLREGKSY